MQTFFFRESSDLNKKAENTHIHCTPHCFCIIFATHYNTNIDMEAIVRKQTSFRLREDLLRLLQEHARKANRSLNNFVESTLMDAMYSEPNGETIAAINEARSGEYAGTIDTADFEAFMKSVNKIE